MLLNMQNQVPLLTTEILNTIENKWNYPLFPSPNGDLDAERFRKQLIWGQVP